MQMTIICVSASLKIKILSRTLKVTVLRWYMNYPQTICDYLLGHIQENDPLVLGQ